MLQKERGMTVEHCLREDIDELARLRTALWPGHPEPAHRAELAERLSAGEGEAAVFLARSEAGDGIGFAEVTLRRDYVNGCDTTPVVFLEGIYGGTSDALSWDQMLPWRTRMATLSTWRSALRSASGLSSFASSFPRLTSRTRECDNHIMESGAGWKKSSGTDAGSGRSRRTA